MKNKLSISEVARQNNSARVSKFASSMIPPAPQVDTPDDEEKEEQTGTDSASQPASALAEVIEKGEADFEQGRGTVLTIDELRSAVTPDPSPAGKGTTRKRAAANTLAMEDILGNKAPDEETFPKMTRIAEKHHDLLRKIAYVHRKPMNTVLYNLLEVLDQAYQRNQQNDV